MRIQTIITCDNCGTDVLDRKIDELRIINEKNLIKLIDMEESDE